MQTLAANDRMVVSKDVDPDTGSTVYATYYRDDACHEFFFLEKNLFLESRLERALNEKGIAEFSSIMEEAKELVTTSSIEENCYELNGRVYAVLSARKKGKPLCISVRRKIPFPEINNYPTAWFFPVENKVRFDGDSSFSPEDFELFLNALQKGKPINKIPKIRRLK